VSGKGRLDRFVAPRPRRWMMRLTAPLNRALTLRRIAGVRRVEFPPADEARLRAVCGKGRATFIAPNHPEFFTDWMIDKEVVSRVAPMAAAWATNTVVNGMGALAQRFWLANNLIAQIPGRTEAARAHSVDWALKGQGVLLHPEGAVGWHGDWVAPLLPGTAEMALEALARGRAEEAGFEAWIAPVVWKLVFLDDADAALKAECAYVERSLEISGPADGASLGARIHALYEALLARDEAALGIAVSRAAPLASRLDAALAAGAERLRALTGGTAEEPAQTVRAARRWLREAKADASASAEARMLIERLQRLMRLGPFAWREPTMTQEQAAEHLKRIRSDYLEATRQDRIHRLVPRPVAPRRAILRVPEPIEVASFVGSPAALTEELRRRLQAGLDGLNAELRAGGAFRTCENPFHG
jgi:hypothetical protein